MAKQTTTTTAAKSKAAETEKTTGGEQPEEGADAEQTQQPDKTDEQPKATKRPAELSAEPGLAEVAAFVGVPQDQVFAFKVHPDRAVIVTVAGQRHFREL